MNIGYSAALLRGWRFSYDDLLELFGISWANGDNPDKEDEMFDLLYDTMHFYSDDVYADRDCQTYYLGYMIQENDICDTGKPITQYTLAQSNEQNQKLIYLWNSLFPTKPRPNPQVYLFPRIT